MHLLVSRFDQHLLKVEVAHYYARNFRHQCRKHAGIDYFLDFVLFLRPSQNMQEVEILVSQDQRQKQQHVLQSLHYLSHATCVTILNR